MTAQNDIWRELLALARWTPSPHNTQPWRLRVIDEAHARLFLDHRRALPKEDATGCFIVCAMGSFIEALRLLAANRKHRLVSTPLDGPRDDDLQPFADLELIPDESVTGTFDDDVFLRRQTSRLPPDDRLLTTDERTVLQRAAADGGQAFHAIDDPTSIARLMELNLCAVVEDLNARDYHDEIVSWFRYSERSAILKRDGLSARCMGIPPAEFFLFAHTPWLATLPVVGAAVRRAYQRRLGPVAQLGAIAGPFWNTAAATSAGATLMQLWLRMAEHGLTIHPFGNLVTNDDARDGMCTVTGDDDIWLIFRIGRTPPPPRSHRLDVGDISNV